MKPSFDMFLLIAEEMSISRAAQRAFVTQQCVSDHIKRLEEEYQVRLFERRPRLQLTHAGEVMLRTLRSIRILERNMDGNLKEVSDGTQGDFVLGISTSRAQTFLPALLKRYYQAFPKVSISFYVEDTPLLEERLLKGELDIFVGINTTQRPEFNVLPLAKDEMVLIISDNLLRHHFDEAAIQQFVQGADLARFSEIPFTLYYRTGRVNEVITSHLDYYNLRLKTIYNVSDCDTHILLCASGFCASLCPQMLLSRAYEHNRHCQPQERIHIFPVKGFQRKLRLDLISHQSVIQPFYLQRFIEMLQEEVAQFWTELPPLDHAFEKQDT